MKKRRQAPPARILRPRHWTGAAELVATVGDKYRVDFDSTQVDPILGPIFVGPRGIRGPDGFEARPGLTESALYDLVSRLNAGLPVSREARGIGKKPKYAGRPARWAEILLNVPETRALLLEAKASGGKLSPDFVRGLMTYHDDKGGPDFRKVFPLPTAEPAPAKHVGNSRIENRQIKRQLDAERVAAETRRIELAEDEERKLVDAVGRQLARILEIERTNWRATKKAKR
jgi:hypothetical protein